MAEPLKTPARDTAAASDRMQRDVSEVLLRIERCGERAVREFSRTLDDWDPPSFLVDADEIMAAAGEVGIDLLGQAEHGPSSPAAGFGGHAITAEMRLERL